MTPAVLHAPIRTPTTTTGPLSERHLAELAEAKHSARRLHRAATVARVSAWTTGVFGAITLLGILLGDLVSFALGAGLLVAAIREGRLAGRMEGLDAGAPGALALNQLMLGAIIVAYAAWQIRATLVSPGILSGSGALAELQGDGSLAGIEELSRRIMIAFYVGVAIIAGVSTGLMALYYRSRRAVLDRFLVDTPPWVVELMRAR